MAKVDVKYRFCGKIESVKKHGLGKANHLCYRCQLCYRTFKLIMLTAPASPE